MSIPKFLVSKLPLAIYEKFTSSDYVVAYYHAIYDHELLHIKHLYSHKSVQQFIMDIDFVLQHFTPISLAALLANNRSKIHPANKSFHLTFDDGFREIYDIVAPILLQKGIPATFFINSSFTDNRNLCYQHKASLIIEHLLKTNVSKTVSKKIAALLQGLNGTGKDILQRILTIRYDQRDLVDEIGTILDIDFKDYLQKQRPYLTSEEVRKLIKKGFTIGAHSIDHPLYADLTLDEQIRQTTESVRFVKNTFNLDYGAFAFPHTDLGVSKRYFAEIAKSGLVDVSFGTAGMIDDCIPRSIQRFSLEKPLIPAKNIFALQSAKQLWRKIKHTNLVQRTDY